MKQRIIFLIKGKGVDLVEMIDLPGRKVRESMTNVQTVV